MGPEQFRVWMERVFSLIPDDGANIHRIVQEAIKGDTTGYARTDARAALLALKADGRIRIEDDGMVYVR